MTIRNCSNAYAGSEHRELQIGGGNLKARFLELSDPDCLEKAEEYLRELAETPTKTSDIDSGSR